MVSKKDDKSINENLVKTKIGSTVVNKDILTFKVYNGAKEYTIGELLEKVITLENVVKTQNKKIATLLEIVNQKNTVIVDNEELLNERLAKLEYLVEDKSGGEE